MLFFGSAAMCIMLAKSKCIYGKHETFFLPCCIIFPFRSRSLVITFSMNFLEGKAAEGLLTEQTSFREKEETGI